VAAPSFCIEWNLDPLCWLAHLAFLLSRIIKNLFGGLSVDLTATAMAFRLLMLSLNLSQFCDNDYACSQSNIISLFY